MVYLSLLMAIDLNVEIPSLVNFIIPISMVNGINTLVAALGYGEVNMYN